jgi:membrane-bound lytic murein transglycosylase
MANGGAGDYSVTVQPNNSTTGDSGVTPPGATMLASDPRPDALASLV